MSTNFDTEQIEQYEDILGTDKVKFLFSEYLDKVEKDMSSINKVVKENNLEELRTIYHTLRSASLVFGIKKFADICTKIEDMIVDGKQIKDFSKHIEEGKQVLELEINQVKKHLGI